MVQANSSQTPMQMQRTVGSLCVVCIALLIPGLLLPWERVSVNSSCPVGSYDVGPFRPHSDPAIDGLIVAVGIAILAVGALTAFGLMDTGRPLSWLYLEIVSGLALVAVGVVVSRYSAPSLCYTTTALGAGAVLTLLGWLAGFIALIALAVTSIVHFVNREHAKRRRDARAQHYLAGSLEVAQERDRAAEQVRIRRVQSLLTLVLEMRDLFNEQAVSHEADQTAWAVPLHSPEALARLSLGRKLEAQLASFGSHFHPATAIHRLTTSYLWSSQCLDEAVRELTEELGLGGER
jgi:hypothetical protein